MIQYNINYNNSDLVNYNTLINNRLKSLNINPLNYIHRPLNSPNTSFTNLGITPETFTINKDFIPFSSFVNVINSETTKDDTLVNLILRSSVDSIFIENINSEYNSEYIYGKIIDKNKQVLCVIEFQLDNNKNILNKTLIIDNDFSTDVLSYGDNFLKIDDLTLEIAGPVTSIYFSTLGPKYIFSINTNMVLERSIDLQRNFQDAEIKLIFGLSKSSVSISGGSGYSVGDIFEIFGSASETDGGGILQVTKVDANGGIQEYEILFDGSFTSLPNNNTIIYDGLGTNCNIIIQDLFLLKEIVLQNAGEHYFRGDKIFVVTEDDELYPIWGSACEVGGVDDSLVKAKIMDRFLIEDLEIINSGYNHKLAPTIQIVDRASNTLVANTMIETNDTDFFNFREYNL